MTNHTLVIDKKGNINISVTANKDAVLKAGGKWFESGNTLLARLINDKYKTCTIHVNSKKNYYSNPVNEANETNGIGTDYDVYFDPSYAQDLLLVDLM